MCMSSPLAQYLVYMSTQWFRREIVLGWRVRKNSTYNDNPCKAEYMSGQRQKSAWVKRLVKGWDKYMQVIVDSF